MSLRMKQNALRIFAAISMATAGAAIAAGNSAPEAHKHDHSAPVATLQLNAGKQWETDAALRQAMGNIRQVMATSLHDIHTNSLSKEGYGALAETVEKEVGNIVANCKLEPKADAQLHLIVAKLLEGAGQMAGKSKPVNRQGGAVQIIGALEQYGTYFADAGFKPIAH